jgi:hypothetical protein
MSSANLEKIIAEVKALTPDERRQVKELIDSLHDQPAVAAPEDLLAQRLLAAGIINEIKPPLTDLTPYRDRKLIEFEGKPVSEIIVEERR